MMSNEFRIGTNSTKKKGKKGECQARGDKR
jgi:hypothetical protein